jgi:hypothetical protein
MALNVQSKNIIEGLIQSFDTLYEAGERLRTLQQGAIDAGVGQPADADLTEAGYDWFTGAEMVAAFGKIAPILAALDTVATRQAINNIRRFP